MNEKGPNGVVVSKSTLNFQIHTLENWGGIQYFHVSTTFEDQKLVSLAQIENLAFLDFSFFIDYFHSSIGWGFEIVRSETSRSIQFLTTSDQFSTSEASNFKTFQTPT